MRSFFITGLLVLLIAACSRNDKFPRDVLPEKQMREVMWDMIRTGEFLNGFVTNRDSGVSKTPEIEKWFGKIYQLHKINKEQFDKSYAYYKDHPVMMKNILDTLAKRQVYVKPVIRDSSALKDTNNSRRHSIYKPVDSLPRAFDSLRKKMIKSRKNLLNAP
jgi:Domain of unknown function (DUF4296)